MTGGRWGKAERPDGYDFSYGIRLKVKIYADSDYFKIFINDKFFYQYKYRGMTGAQVKKIEFLWNGDDATAAQLANIFANWIYVKSTELIRSGFRKLAS